MSIRIQVDGNVILYIWEKQNIARRITDATQDWIWQRPFACEVSSISKISLSKVSSRTFDRWYVHMYVRDGPKNNKGFATWASTINTFGISHFFVNLYCSQGALIVWYKYVHLNSCRRQCYLVYSRKSRLFKSIYNRYAGLKYVSTLCLRSQLNLENFSFKSIVSHFWQMIGAYVRMWCTEKQNRFGNLGKHNQHISHFSLLCQFVLLTGSANSAIQICRFESK